MIPKDVLETLEALAKEGHYSLPDEEGRKRLIEMLEEASRAHTSHLLEGTTSVSFHFGRARVAWPSVDGRDAWDVWGPIFSLGDTKLLITKPTLIEAVETARKHDKVVRRVYGGEAPPALDPPVTDEERERSATHADRIDTYLRAKDKERARGERTRAEVEDVARAWLEKRLPKVPLVVVQQHDVDSLVDLLLSFTGTRVKDGPETKADYREATAADARLGD